MNHPHPVFRDGDHLYTLCRDGKGYAITMIPVAQGVRGVGHIISTMGGMTLNSATCALKDLARQAGLTRVTKRATREVAPSTDGRPKETTIVYPPRAGLSREGF